MKRLWKWLLAYTRLSESAICEMSVGRREYHDYPDGVDDDLGPVHFYTYTCRRCGKEFTI
jgi:hypothetical protein